MAIAVNGGHVARALEFFRAEGKYFIIGGPVAWNDETNPTPPLPNVFKLDRVAGVKKVDNTHLVIPHPDGSIQFREQNWKIVPAHVETKITEGGITAGTSVIPVESVIGFTEGAKVRIHQLYEATILSLTDTSMTLDTSAPADIPDGASVVGGALIEGAKYVYVDCYLNYDEFPLITYRQVGLCTGVLPNNVNVMKSSMYSVSGKDEYTSLGILEVLDNRPPATRNINQRELLSLIIEF